MNLRPADFWALTPEEWGWLAGASDGSAMSRAELDELLRLYPDQQVTP